MEQLGGFGSGCLSGREQLIRIGPGQVEAALQQPRDDTAIRLVKSVVAVRRFNEQSRQSELQRLLPPARFPAGIRPTAADPRPDAVDHRPA
jgi:hypothetical protein